MFRLQPGAWAILRAEVITQLIDLRSSEWEVGEAFPTDI